MGKRRDFGLGGSGKGDKTRTNLASPQWQKNYDAIFRRKVAPSKRAMKKPVSSVWFANYFPNFGKLGWKTRKKCIQTRRNRKK